MHTKDKRFSSFYWHARVLAHCFTIQSFKHFNTCSPWFWTAGKKNVACFIKFMLSDVSACVKFCAEAQLIWSILNTVCSVLFFSPPLPDLCSYCQLSSHCTWKSKHNLIDRFGFSLHFDSRSKSKWKCCYRQKWFCDIEDITNLTA